MLGSDHEDEQDCEDSGMPTTTLVATTHVDANGVASSEVVMQLAKMEPGPDVVGVTSPVIGSLDERGRCLGAIPKTMTTTTPTPPVFNGCGSPW